MEIQEIWKIIPETNDLYECSNLGNVRRVESLVINNVNGGKRLLKSKNLSQKTKSNGYKEVSIYITPRVGKSKYVHRLVAITFLGEIKTGYVVNHKNGIKSDNKVSNLEIVTYSENSTHSYKVLGNNPPDTKKGEDSHFTNLSNEDVKYIKDNYVKGKSNTDLYNKFKDKIGISGFRKICYGASWK